MMSCSLVGFAMRVRFAMSSLEKVVATSDLLVQAFAHELALEAELPEDQQNMV